jgi:hypothetical protein
MTEAEWLACTDPHHLLMDRVTARELTPRLLRLFAAACWRRRADRLDVPARRADLSKTPVVMRSTS